MGKQIKIDLGESTYNIHWDANYQSLVNWIKEKKTSGKHAVITNEYIHSLYKKEIAELFEGFEVLLIPDGEKEKRLSTIEKLGDRLLDREFTRSSTLWAFGGGVIGDITGFLASIYMRGIQYYQIPTTLLSMVDSSVGGKTGVNLAMGKNMIGAFFQPKGVFIHVPFLKTLADREINCGLSEIIKSAMIGNEPLLLDMIKHVNLINEKSWDYFEVLSQESVKVKAKVVEEDEKETGTRAILNFGHTLAHALESYYSYTELKHGEAVSIGMNFAALLSQRCISKPILTERISSKSAGDENVEITTTLLELLEKLNLKHSVKDLPESNIPEVNDLVKLMKGDKKNIDNHIRFILLKNIGHAQLPEPIDDNIIMEQLETFLK